MCSQNQTKDQVNYYYTKLLESLKETKLKLISYDDNGKDIPLNERAFAYELYRQLANRLYDDIDRMDKWSDKRPSIVVNAELYKCVGDNNNVDNKGRKFPDIVIHGGQHNNDKQLIVCEIKVKASESEIENDIEKLFDYMDNTKMFGKDYKLGVFINVGPKAVFEKNLHSCLVKFDKRKGRLICISYDGGNVTVL